MFNQVFMKMCSFPTSYSENALMLITVYYRNTILHVFSTRHFHGMDYSKQEHFSTSATLAFNVTRKLVQVKEWLGSDQCHLCQQVMGKGYTWSQKELDSNPSLAIYWLCGLSEALFLHLRHGTIIFEVIIKI